MCVCVCAQREWYMTYIARWITCHPKNKTNNNNESSRNCKCFAETSLAQLSMQTHTHIEWISLRYAQEFPQHLVLWYLSLGTLVAACCSRFSSPWMLDSCASCLSASQKSEKKNQLAFSEIASAIRFFFARVESFLKRRKFYPRIFFSILFFKNSFIECSWSEFESTKRVPRNPPSGLFAIGAAPPTRGQYQYHNHQTGSQIHFSKLFGHANYYCCTHCVLENNPQPLSQSTLLYYIPYVYMLWLWPASWQWTFDLIRIESACVSLCKSDWTQYENPLKMAELLLKTGPCTICPKCR